MHSSASRASRRLVVAGALVLVAGIATALVAAASPAGAATTLQPRFTTAVAFDTTAPLRDLAPVGTATERVNPFSGSLPTAADSGFSGDTAVQSTPVVAAIPSTSTK